MHPYKYKYESEFDFYLLRLHTLTTKPIIMHIGTHVVWGITKVIRYFHPEIKRGIRIAGEK